MIMEKKKEKASIIGSREEIEGENWQSPRNDVGIRHEGSLRIARIIEKGSGNKQRDKRREYRVTLALESLCYQHAKTREEYTDPLQFKILLHRMAAEKAKRRRGRQWSDPLPQQHLPFLEFLGVIGGSNDNDDNDIGMVKGEPNPLNDDVMDKSESISTTTTTSSSSSSPQPNTLQQNMTGLFNNKSTNMGTIEEDKAVSFLGKDERKNIASKVKLKVETNMDMDEENNNFIDEAKSSRLYSPSQNFSFSPFPLTIKSTSPSEYSGPVNEEPMAPPSPSPAFIIPSIASSSSSSSNDNLKRIKPRSKSDTQLPIMMNQHGQQQQTTQHQRQDHHHCQQHQRQDQQDFHMERQRTPRRRATTTTGFVEDQHGWFNFDQ